MDKRRGKKGKQIQKRTKCAGRNTVGIFLSSLQKNVETENGKMERERERSKQECTHKKSDRNNKNNEKRKKKGTTTVHWTDTSNLYT